MAYVREEPGFSLCGLNCSLCPRFHTEGHSKCPGCGGPGFSEKHPTCAIVTCNKKRDNVQFCFQCREYPCKKYQESQPVDSFISYANVNENMEDAKRNLPRYLKDLKQRYAYLRELLDNYNDGKSKSFYCIAMNNLPFMGIQEIMTQIHDRNMDTMNKKARAQYVKKIMTEKAKELGIALILRK